MTMSFQLVDGVSPVSGRRVEASEGQHLIGRSPHCHIVIPNPGVSKFHAELIVRGGRVHIRDLGSANGTIVNGKLADHHELWVGDRVDLGGSVFECRSTPASEPALGTGTIAGETMVRERAHYTFDPSAPLADEREALARQHLRLQTFVSGLTTMAQTQDVDEIAARILEVGRELVSAEVGSVLLVGESGTLDVRCTVPLDDPRAVRCSRKALEVVVGGESFLADDARDDQRLADSSTVRDAGLRSILCVPIAHGGRVLGVLYLSTPSFTCAFDSDDLQLIASLGLGAGMAVYIANFTRERARDDSLAAVGLAMTSVAHHMRNVIQAMVGPVYAIARRVGSHDEGPIDASAARVIRKLVPVLESGTKRMNESLQNMLALSKADETALSEGSINDMVSEVVAQVRDRASSNAIVVECELDESVPRSTLDQVRLHDLLLNLAGNAIDAMSSSGQGQKIQLRTTRRGDIVTVEVRDDGPGMSPEVRDAAFSPFFTTKGEHGTGLGLAIARKIAHENDARLTLETSPGQGAIFRLELPLRG